MTSDELDRLAGLIADALLGGRANPPARLSRGDTWLPVPTRPEPPARGGEPPVWSGAAQTLGDIAPGKSDDAPRHRERIGDSVAAIRAAAAGGAPAPRTESPRGRVQHTPRPRERGAPPIDVRVGVSNRHLHLSAEHVRALFGAALTSHRALTQPGQFAANETVAIMGPNGRLEDVRVVGPARGETQLELSLSDAAKLGVTPPLAASGSLANSAGDVALVGPAGRVDLTRGVIIAARHLHLAPADAKRWGLRDGDRLDVRVGDGARAATLHDVLVRAGTGHATELHLDVDEARATGVATGATATIIGWRTSAARRRPLLTERDVVALAKRGERIPANAMLTPSARDRARALGLQID